MDPRNHAAIVPSSATRLYSSAQGGGIVTFFASVGRGGRVYDRAKRSFGFSGLVVEGEWCSGSEFH